MKALTQKKVLDQVVAGFEQQPQVSWASAHSQRATVFLEKGSQSGTIMVGVEPREDGLMNLHARFARQHDVVKKMTFPELETFSEVQEALVVMRKMAGYLL